ncbi:hypothetical protein HB780_00945 (plasmid) [Rhizobium lusitanum]|nr:hypothetical protein HB780_00945 [Rhizobium lusitanum]
MVKQHKHNVARRYRIGKMKFKVTNWREYEAGSSPRRTTRGGQPRYSDLAIEATLTLGMAFGLSLRKGEGLLGLVTKLMGLELPMPDHKTLSQWARAWMRPAKGSDRQLIADRGLQVLVEGAGLKIDGAGQWRVERHGVKARRGEIITRSTDGGCDRRRHL